MLGEDEHEKGLMVGVTISLCDVVIIIEHRVALTVYVIL